MHTNQQPTESYLVPLSRLKKYEVADGEPDVRGWDALDAGQKKIGEVQDLIVDPQKLLVRYLQIALDKEITQTRQSQHILVPIGFATMAKFEDQVCFNTLPAEVILNSPPYEQGSITREFEQEIRKALVMDLLPPGLDFYAGQAFDASGIFGPRDTSHEPRASGTDGVI